MFKHQPKSLEHLYREHKHMELVFGSAIIVIAVIVTGLVWFAPNFQTALPVTAAVQMSGSTKTSIPAFPVTKKP